MKALCDRVGMDSQRRRQRIKAEARRSEKELSRKLSLELRRLRLDVGLSQKVAEAAGLSQPLLSMVENAKTDLNLPTLIALATALGATVNAGIFRVPDRRSGTTCRRGCSRRSWPSSTGAGGDSSRSLCAGRSTG